MRALPTFKERENSWKAMQRRNQKVLDDAVAAGKKRKVKSAKTKLNPPFKFLGHRNADYFYFSRRLNEVVKLTPNQHRGSKLLQLADLAWWETAFGIHCFIGRSQAEITDWMFDQQAAVGSYNPSKCTYADPHTGELKHGG